LRFGTIWREHCSCPAPGAVRLISSVLPVGLLHQPRKSQRPAPDHPTGKIEAEDPAAATGRAYNHSNITAPDLGRFFCVREEFKNSKVDMSLSEPLRASAQHIELLQHKRHRLADALVSAELQFLAALRRECLDGGMTWAQLREAYSVLSAGRLPGLRARWMDAVPVSPEDVILNARREAAVGAGGVWRGHRPLHRGEYYPPIGQWVVYVLFDVGRYPVYVRSTNRCSQRFADHRAQGKRWSSWTAYAVDSAEAHKIQARFMRRDQTDLNRQRARA
jgi:hypothetical protein